MQGTRVQPVPSVTTAPLNTTTMSREQILIQSSGAMIAVIVIGITIILGIILIILMIYNRKTRVSRVLGTRSRKKMWSSTAQTNLPMGNLGSNSCASGSQYRNENGITENEFRLPRVEMHQNVFVLYATDTEPVPVSVHSSSSLENT
ncbi:noncompact myelin-associated protein [Lepisosteus oculatus]|uniref:noncompact myelin-associated protein n=1 Tax=Lepisosteus oculatus TaxID=7918 RepID=UPI0035F50C59